MAAFISIKTCISHNACTEGVIRALRSKPDSKSIDEPLALHELSECTNDDLLWGINHTGAHYRDITRVHHKYRGFVWQQQAAIKRAMPGSFTIRGLQYSRRERLNTLLRYAGAFDYPA